MGCAPFLSEFERETGIHKSRMHSHFHAKIPPIQMIFPIIPHAGKFFNKYFINHHKTVTIRGYNRGRKWEKGPIGPNARAFFFTKCSHSPPRHPGPGKSRKGSEGNGTRTAARRGAISRCERRKRRGQPRRRDCGPAASAPARTAKTEPRPTDGNGTPNGGPARRDCGPAVKNEKARIFPQGGSFYEQRLGKERPFGRR